MAAASLCLLLFLLFDPVTTLTIKPNRGQFFHYEEITMTCEGSGKVKRNAKFKQSEWCGNGGFGKEQGDFCTLSNLYPSDSGTYWCESEEGEMLGKVNITVTNPWILEMPATPVTEGDKVTLRCSYKERHEKEVKQVTASFYKDNVFIGNDSNGKLTIKAEEGFYKCQDPDGEGSPQSWLAVIKKPDPVPTKGKELQLPSSSCSSSTTMSPTMLLCIILVFIP